MKNKSKLKKIKEKKNTQTGYPTQWLFLSKQEIGVREIKTILDTDASVSLEIWETAGVLEVTLADGKTIDMEAAAVDLHDAYSNEFLSQNQTKSLFYVNVYPDSFALAKPVMEKIAKQADGMFCGDTDDFTPVMQ